MQQKDIIAFDLETTGTEISKSYIIQIALKKLRPTECGFDIISQWQTYIEPPIDIPPIITEITGISNETVKGAPTFASIAQAFVNKLRGCDLMTYNAMSLDLPLLAEDCDRAGVQFLKLNEFRLVDPYQIFVKNEPRTLAGAVKFYCHDTLSDAHDAMNDVNAMIKVFSEQRSFYGLSDDVAYWAAESKPATDKDYADFSRNLYWENDELYYGFGKNKGSKVDDNLGYAQWVLNNEFSASTKTVLRAWMKRKTPELL